MAIVLLVCWSCSTQRKISKIKKENLQVTVAVAQDNDRMHQLYSADTTSQIDKVEIQNIHGESIIMNAVKDDESGEMVAMEQLQAIVVEAKFRNLAERNG